MFNNDSSVQNTTNLNSADFYLQKVEEFCSSDEVEEDEKTKLLTELLKCIKLSLSEKGMTKEEIEQGISKAILENQKSSHSSPQI